jgi:hypothetical protein
VINFPSCDLYEQVERIAGLTGSDPVPKHKQALYHYAADKFTAGNFSRRPSTRVLPPRIAECPIQLEAVLKAVLDIVDDPITVFPWRLCLSGFCVPMYGKISLSRKTILIRQNGTRLFMTASTRAWAPNRVKPLKQRFEILYGIECCFKDDSTPDSAFLSSSLNNVLLI